MMQQIALVTGADRGLGLALAAGLLDRGWQVWAGQFMPDWPDLDRLAASFPELLRIVPIDVASGESVRAAAQHVAAHSNHLDLVINNAGVNSPTSPRPIREPQNYDEMRRLYETNSLGPLRVVEAFLPLTDRGALKRLCFVSSEAGSIGAAQRRSWFGYCMSKAALNMATRLLHNDLRHQGYSLRVYHPGWIRSYISGTKGTDADMEPEEAAIPALGYFLQQRDDDDRLVLRDWKGDEWPW